MSSRLSQLLALALAMFATPALIHAQDMSVRRVAPPDLALSDVRKKKESQMTPSTVNGPQGPLVAFHTSSGKAKELPLVFLHADPGRATQWKSVMTLMAKTHDMTAFDFRGSGASAPPADGDYSYAGRASDIAAVVDAFKLKRFVIVAHSTGAAVALTYAAANGGRVDGIVMVDPVTDPRAMPAEVLDGLVRDMTGPNSAQVFKTYVESIAGPNPAVRQQVIADAQTHDATGRAGMAKALGMWNPDLTLKAFKGPIFILSTPATDNAGALYRLRPDIPHEVVPADGHWIQMDQPTVVAKAIEKFVLQLNAKPGEGLPPRR